jgi:hypothetical protein
MSGFRAILIAPGKIPIIAVACKAAGKEVMTQTMRIGKQTWFVRKSPIVEGGKTL